MYLAFNMYLKHENCIYKIKSLAKNPLIIIAPATTNLISRAQFRYVNSQT